MDSPGLAAWWKGMVDTGTNLNIANERLLRELGLTLHTTQPPVTITFGNGTQSTSYMHARLGGWIGDIHCVDTATEILLSIHYLEAQLYSLYIHKLFMYIFSPLGHIVMSIPRCPSTHMYYVDIPQFLLTYPPSSNIVSQEYHGPAPPTVPPSASVAGARRQGPISKVTIGEVLWLHYRMNHPSRVVMAAALRNGAWTGVTLTAADIERVLGKMDCLICAQTKYNKLPINLGSGVRPPWVGHTVSCDFKPVSPKGVGGFIGFYLFSCCLTLYLHGFLVKTKVGLETLTQQVQLFYAQHGHKMVILRVDAGKVENAAEFTSALLRMGIQPDAALPEQQYENPVERSMQTLVKGVSAMMLMQSYLPAVFWPFAVLDWIHTRNYTPNALTVTSAPITCVTKELPNLSKRFKFPFGSPVVSTVLNRTGQLAKHGTFVERNEFGITLGSTKGNNGGTLLHIPARGGTGARAYHRGDIHLLRMPTPTPEEQLLLTVQLDAQEDILDAQSAKGPTAPALFISSGEDSWVARHTNAQLSTEKERPPSLLPCVDIPYSILLDTMASSIHECSPLPLATTCDDVTMTAPTEHNTETHAVWPTISQAPNSVHECTLPIPDVPGFVPPIPHHEALGALDAIPLPILELPVSAALPLPLSLPPTHDLPTYLDMQVDDAPQSVGDEQTQRYGPQSKTMTLRSRSFNKRASMGLPWTPKLEAMWDHRIERERTLLDRINDVQVQKNKEGWFGTSVIRQHHADFKLPSCVRRSCNSAKASPPRFNNKKKKQVSISLTQAQASPNWDKYEASITKEYGTLDSLNTGTQVDGASVTGRILPTRYVFKIKRDGTYKCRLVVLGNLEIKRESMFSPTANDKSLRLLLALSITHGLTLKGYDIFGAFCNPELNRTVHIRLPDGRIWRLNKALYGLRDSPKLFYEDVSSLLISKGYRRCDNDPCMFVKKDDRGILMAVIHVDDFAIASDSEDMHEELRDPLFSKYTITTNDLNDFLGFNIGYNDDGSMTLTMPKLLTATILEFLHDDTTADPSSPMSEHFNDPDQDASPRTDTARFLSLLGKLIYMVKCRPEIAYAISRLSCRSDGCTDKDWACLLRVLRFLRATRDHGLTFSRANANDRHLMSTIFCYADAAFNVHTDSKSHSGYCISLGGPPNGMFYFRSFKQSNVSLSSTEAEVNAAVEAAKEIVWLRNLLAELGYVQHEPTVLYADNKSMITLCTEYSGNHKRVKHYLNRINYMLKQVKTGVITLEYMSTTEHKADGLTKPLPPKQAAQSAIDLLGTSSL